ncbi:MAG: hypothetical protein N2578_02930 [Bdellovibrionaceae bacterium]|nr:hypothetical protein [Pseudobdellovibrionaceae bacterium]
MKNTIPLVLLMILFGHQARAVVIDGKILDASSNPPNGVVPFIVEIRAPASGGGCLLYKESRSVDMTGTGGLFSFSLGSPGGARIDTGTQYALSEIFRNGPGVNLMNLAGCSSGSTYSPGQDDNRQLFVFFDPDGTGPTAFQMIGPVAISHVPLAHYAQDAGRGGGIPGSQVMSVSGGPVAPLTPANFSELLALVNGTSTNYYSSANPPPSVGDASYSTKGVVQFQTDAATSGIDISGGVARVNTGTGANQIVKLDGSGALPAVSGANLTNLNASNLNSGTVPAGRMPAFSGDVTTTAGSTVTTIANSAGSTAKLADGSVATAKIADGAVTTVKLANDAVTGAKIFDGTITSADMDFTGVNTATSSIVIRDNTGKFFNFACSTAGHVVTWTVAGFACQAPAGGHDYGAYRRCDGFGFRDCDGDDCKQRCDGD